MDELITNTIRNIEKFGDNHEMLISMLARDVYLNDMIYVSRCSVCCKKGEGWWKEYKQLQWYDMKMPDDLRKKLNKLSTLIQKICERLVLSPDESKSKAAISLMRVNLKITSETYDCDKIIKYSKRLYRVKSCPCENCRSEPRD